MTELMQTEAGVYYQSPSDESKYEDIILEGKGWVAMLQFRWHPMLNCGPDWVGHVFYHDARDSQHFHSGHTGNKGALK